MYSKCVPWMGPLLLTLAACSSGSDGSDGSDGSGPGAPGGAPGSAGTPGGLGGAGNNGGAPPTAGNGASGAGASNAGAPSAGSPNGGSAGSAGSAGASSVAGSSSGGSGASGGGAAGSTLAGAGGGSNVPPGASGLPNPPGTADVPKPTGTPGAITVVNWAGFKGAVTYSFDDSNTSQIQNYPALHAIGVPYTFYMWTGKSEASNSIWATALKDGNEIGNHTMSHDSNGHCTTADINSATAFIQSKLNSKAWTMAAPNGSACFVPLSKGLFFINRGVQPAQPVMPNGNSDPANLNCYIPATGQQAGTFKNNVDDGRSKGGWVIYVVHGFTGDGSAYQPVDFAQMTAAISYAKSLGDMWVGTMVNVGAYWLGQKAFSSAMTSTSGTDKTWTWTLPGQFPTGKFLRVKVAGGTLKQKGVALTWDPHGYYEVALDAGSVTLSP